MTGPTARQKIMQAALDLFRKQGFEATGVDQLIQQAGVSKGSFYHAFKSKEALGLAVLDDYFTARRLALANGPHRSQTDPVQRALAFLDHAAEISTELWGHGCLLATFSSVAGQTRPAVRQRLQRLFESSEQELTALFAPVVAAAQRSGMSGVASAESLARRYLSALQGAIVQSRLFDQPDRIQEVILGFRQDLHRLAQLD